MSHFDLNLKAATEYNVALFNYSRSLVRISYRKWSHKNQHTFYVCLFHGLMILHLLLASRSDVKNKIHKFRFISNFCSTLDRVKSGKIPNFIAFMDFFLRSQLRYCINNHLENDINKRNVLTFDLWLPA